MPLACLPWYDLIETHCATDRLWHHIATALREFGVDGVPEELDRRSDYEDQWRSPDLLIGQACGYDVFCENEHQLQVVAAPLYGLPGCTGSRYRSFVVVREDSQHRRLEDLRDARCVINSPRSHSGMNVLQALIAPLACEGSFFAEVGISGAHERSLELMLEGQADVAAIDCITYGLLLRHRPSALAHTRVVHESPSLTAPPYVTGYNTDPALLAILHRAIERAVESLSHADREDLGLLGVERVRMSDYKGIASLRAAAQAARYTELSRATYAVPLSGAAPCSVDTPPTSAC